MKKIIIHGNTVKKWQNIYVFVSFSHVYVSHVGSVTIANGQIE